jgi:hypothetical protein
MKTLRVTVVVTITDDPCTASNDAIASGVVSAFEPQALSCESVEIVEIDTLNPKPSDAS